MDTLEKRVQTALFGMQDLEYKAFQSRLMPTIDPDRIIGIRTPQLRKFAKEFIKTGDAAAFLEILPHTYYEENNLHGFLIESYRITEEQKVYLRTLKVKSHAGIK